jgi:hypothetical protein
VRERFHDHTPADAGGVAQIALGARHGRPKAATRQVKRSDERSSGALPGAPPSTRWRLGSASERSELAVVAEQPVSATSTRLLRAGPAEREGRCGAHAGERPPVGMPRAQRLLAGQRAAAPIVNWSTTTARGSRAAALGVRHIADNAVRRRACRRRASGAAAASVLRPAAVRADRAGAARRASPASAPHAATSSTARSAARRIRTCRTRWAADAPASTCRGGPIRVAI